MALPDLSMMRGDTRTFTLTLYDDDEEPLDLIGLEITFTAKARLSDADAFVTKTLDDGVTAGEGGSITVTLEPADTEDVVYSGYQDYVPYVWDVQTTDDYLEVHTRRRGVLKVYRDVTTA